MTNPNNLSSPSGDEMLLPCRECAAPGQAEVFGGTTVWLCSNHAMFGGNCLSDTAYLTIAAWNDRPQPEGDVVERVARAIYDEQKSCTLYDELNEGGRNSLRRKARAAIAALSQQPNREVAAIRELTALREGIEQSAWHQIGNERMKRILVAETAIARIDAAISTKEPGRANKEHGPHCSDYHQACPQCLEDFRAWKEASHDQNTPTVRDDELVARLREHVHLMGWGYAGPYRCGIAAGELGLDVEPWWPTEQSCRIFRDGVELGRERARKALGDTN
jgi:hypothetical protein